MSASLLKGVAVAMTASLAMALVPAAAHGQAGAPVFASRGGHDLGAGGWQEATAGSVLEEYLRTLQVAGIAPPAMVSLRAWSPWELPRITPSDTAHHPWAAHLRHAQAPGSRARLALLRPSTRTTYNSAFPFGLDDGATWAGRGVTQEASAGVQVTWGPLMVQLAPVAFWTQNAEVMILPNGLDGDARFADSYPYIDRPQRFGTGSYARVDPGQSTIRLDLFGLTAGFSTANEVWGPGVTHPLVLGANAAGIPRLFAGTARPADLWIGKVHGRMMIGRLDSSPFAPLQLDSLNTRTRTALAMVIAFSPRFAPNLEVGLTRFYQKPWPEGGPGIGDVSILFEGFLKGGGAAYDTRSGPQNQVASGFFRWSVPPAFEVYGEAYREDHSADLRDFELEPEHDLGYLLGLRRVWRGNDTRRITTLRMELVNGRPTRLAQGRPQTHLYTHGYLRSGHTQQGQVLGSEALMGGGGGILGMDRYTEAGRFTVEYQRVGRHWLENGPAQETFKALGQDVIHALGGEIARFRGPIEWRLGAQLLMEVNRDFQRDVVGVQVTAGARWMR